MFATADLSEYKKLLKTLLKPERYEHSLGASETAKKLAEKWGADREKAELAGLLHDITKNMPDTEQLNMLKKYGVPLTEEVLACPFIWHSYTSAFYVRDILGITDGEIFDGIYYHTTGKRGMTLFEKVIYIADLVEPNRSYPDAKRLYTLAFEDLDEVVFESARWCLFKNSRDGGFIFGDTFELYNECVLKRREKDERKNF